MVPKDLPDVGLPQAFNLFKKKKNAVSAKHNNVKDNKMRYVCISWKFHRGALNLLPWVLMRIKQDNVYEYPTQCLAYKSLSDYYFLVSHFKFLDFSKNLPKWNSGWIFIWYFEFNVLISLSILLFLFSQGYAFLLFQEESSVQALIDACLEEDGKLYLCVSSPTIKDKPVSDTQPADALREHVCIWNNWLHPLCNGNAGN